MEKKLSITDIAIALKVSKTTVSFVINGKGRAKRISSVVERRILDYIEAVGYQPNEFARALSTGKSNIIVVMIEDVSDPFFSGIARMIEESAHKKGYKIIYSSTENDTKKTKELLKIYRAQNVDGYIIAPPLGIEEEIKSLLAANLPVVLFDRFFPSISTNNVVVNNYKGTYGAVNHFFNSGHRNVAFVTLSSEQIQMQQRLDGYMTALAEHEAQCFIKKIVYHEELDKLVEEIEQFLKMNKQLDAVFFSTNYLAEAGLEAIQNLKLKIPKDLGVIVFDDCNFFRLFTPSITAVAQPLREISENIINLLLTNLSDPELHQEKQTIIIPTQLMIRNSTLKGEAKPSACK
ncbi:substrate-binding domain-containing protein [Pedobacter sp. P351]|uniref:LacI family DNA-binding transcriptional regulator n=1 Tax=Pedobacter superstes TaxID=3133441 RepID=UPI0030B2284C